MRRHLPGKPVEFHPSNNKLETFDDINKYISTKKEIQVKTNNIRAYKFGQFKFFEKQKHFKLKNNHI